MIDERSIHHKTSPGRYRNLDSKWEHCSLGDTMKTKDGYASLCACKILCTSCNDLANPNGRELITLYKTVQQIVTTRRQQVARRGLTYFLEQSWRNTSFCFFFQLCENISLVSWMKLASIPEGIKPRHTPSIRIENSDWKGDLNAVVLPLVN